MRSINWTVSSTFSTVRFEFKRGALFSLDDAKNHDLIFVGSPSENLKLLDIPGTEELVFRRLDSGSRKGNLAVLNVHPLAGEPKTFLATPANQPTTKTTLWSAGFRASTRHFILVLGGNSTFSTPAAVVCREDSVKELLQRLKVAKVTELTPFEALVHVKIAHGVPVMTDLVSVRNRSH